MSRSTIIAFSVSLLAFGVGCSGPREGLEVSTLPSDVQGDYEVFAQRCSKCHSLSRPLNSGITDDEWWGRYVAKMRRMPASGISHDDATQILRFLHWFSGDQLKKKGERTSGAVRVLGGAR
jgi:hypothetical protein